MTKLPLINDRAAGRETYLHISGDDMTAVTEQKVDGILDYNKAMSNDWRPGQMIGNTQRHHQKVAEIPSAVYFDLLGRFGTPAHNQRAWKKWLNDPENRYFKTIGGSI